MDRIEELAVLVAIIEGGSLAAAARKTSRSAAAVTRILGEFETRLGVRLIERTTRQSVPTDAGRRLAERAVRILADYEDAIRDATGDAATPSGQLRISAPLVFGRKHIAPVVARFLDAYPKVKVELVLSNIQLDLVEQGIDVALRIGHLHDSSLVARRVGQVGRIVVASPAYLAGHGTPRDPDELASHECVLHATGSGAAPWQFNIPERGTVTARPHGRLVVNQAETMIEAACAGRGLIRPLSYQVAEQLASGELVRVLREFEPAPLPVNIVFTSARLMALRTRVFVDFAAEALRGVAALNWE